MSELGLSPEQNASVNVKPWFNQGERRSLRKESKMVLSFLANYKKCTYKTIETTTGNREQTVSFMCTNTSEKNAMNKLG